MKKLVSLLLALCLLLGSVSGALAYDATKPACQTPGHEKYDGADHNRPQSCWTKGHFACDGMNHDRADCGHWNHFNCDGREHVAADCGAEGHFLCKGTHAQAACGFEGHCVSDGLRHVPAGCKLDGHFTCVGTRHYDKPISEYCNAEPQHKPCEGDPEHFCDPEQGGCGETYLCSRSNEHTTCVMCGLLWCDETLGSHDAPCGNKNHRPCYYTLQGKTWIASEHPRCHLCDGGKCTGRHGLGVCVPVCDHCNQSLRGVGTHRAKCGVHFECVSKRPSHSWCSKHNMFKCQHDCK